MKKVLSPIAISALMVVSLLLSVSASAWEVCTSYCESCAENKIRPCEFCYGEDGNGFTFEWEWCGSCDRMC